MTWYPYQSPPPPIDPEAALRQTETWWRRWADGYTYTGPWRDQVVRSLLTLKALTHHPTGGIVAAPTTSLPEALGGTRNWDWYCWVRDATFTLVALVASGYEDEAAAWRDWLLRAVAGEPSRVQIAYGIAGERRIEEMQLDWLSGYEDSRPVRVGNAAHSQRQLDIYGEIAGCPACRTNAWAVITPGRLAHAAGVAPVPRAGLGAARPGRSGRCEARAGTSRIRK